MMKTKKYKKEKKGDNVPYTLLLATSDPSQCRKCRRHIPGNQKTQTNARERIKTRNNKSRREKNNATMYRQPQPSTTPPPQTVIMIFKNEIDQPWSRRMTTWKTRHREKDKPTNVKGVEHRMREAVGEHARHNHVHGQGVSKMGADTHTATTAENENNNENTNNRTILHRSESATRAGAARSDIGHKWTPRAAERVRNRIENDKYTSEKQQRRTTSNRGKKNNTL